MTRVFETSVAYANIATRPSVVPSGATMLNAIRIAVAVALAVLRIGGVTHPSFQAAAHVFIGGLIGAWCITRSWRHGGPALGLLAVEVAMFAVMLIRI